MPVLLAHHVLHAHRHTTVCAARPHAPPAAEDHQLLAPSFLELLNALLSGGEVPGLFSAEELSRDLGPLDAALAAGAEEGSFTGPRTAFAYFTYRWAGCRQMDPSKGRGGEAGPCLELACRHQEAYMLASGMGVRKFCTSAHATAGHEWRA
jgi:hypothetical protein